jgi:hypothetical protein
MQSLDAVYEPDSGRAKLRLSLLFTIDRLGGSLALPELKCLLGLGLRLTTILAATCAIADDVAIPDAALDLRFEKT